MLILMLRRIQLLPQYFVSENRDSPLMFARCMSWCVWFHLGSAATFAFLAGPWLEAAKAWGAGNNDCGSMTCTAFYEWNARCQITSWFPTPANASEVPGNVIDYASKHWSGLIRDYYAVRAGLVLTQV